MQVAVEQGTELGDLFRLAQAGEEVLLTQGAARVRLVRAEPDQDVIAQRREALEQLREAGRHATPGPSAARSADWLYGDDGLPA